MFKLKLEQMFTLILLKILINIFPDGTRKFVMPTRKKSILKNTKDTYRNIDDIYMYRKFFTALQSVIYIYIHNYTTNILSMINYSFCFIKNMLCRRDVVRFIESQILELLLVKSIYNHFTC